MNTYQKKVLKWAFPLLAVALLCMGLVLKLASSHPKIIEPYPDGTKITVYKSALPPDMLPGVMVEAQARITESSVVALPDGKKDVSVSYLSKLDLASLFPLYRTFLKNNSWDATTSQTDNKVGVIVVHRKDIDLTLTLVRDDMGTRVTINYKQ